MCLFTLMIIDKKSTIKRDDTLASRRVTSKLIVESISFDCNLEDYVSEAFKIQSLGQVLSVSALLFLSLFLTKNYYVFAGLPFA